MNDIDILKLYFSGSELDKAVEKYKNGIPAAYIIGEWEFFGDRYYIDENCLIPRCDTERVVECLLANLPENACFADLCTGSGCIAISTLKRKPYSKSYAVDISEKALDVAKRNAILNGVENRIEFICSDVFQTNFGDRKFDVIVSNPPYIPTKDLEKLDVYVKTEPISALDGGDDGMDFYRHIVSKFKNNLSANGKFIFEIGFDQEEQIKKVALENGFECTVKKDYSGNPRVALLQ